MIKKLHNPKLQFEVKENIAFRSMSAFYQQLDLYLHPSKAKAVDKSGLEAVFAHTPVLLSLYCYQEICRDFADILFDPENPVQLAKKITTAIDNYAIFKKKQAALQKYIIKNFSLIKFMKKLSHLYSE